MGMSLALGAESPKFGVRVVGVNPGPIMTDRVKKLGAKRAEQLWGDASRHEELYTHYPFGRPGTVDEVSPMVVFLASDHASYISGTIVTINGGMSARSTS